MEQMMKVVRLHDYGGPDVLMYEDMARPEPGPGEVQVRVRAAGVNPIDWKVREGYMQGYFGHTLPLVLGWAVSGTVAALGAGVTDLKVGDEVYGQTDFSRNGSYAQYVIVTTETLTHKPRNLDHFQSAAVPIAGLAAWHGLLGEDTINLQPGQTVLIHAAAGGVGTIAVQLAKWKGARVIGTASGPNLDLVRDLGADEAVDYTKQPFEDVVGMVDAVLDNVGGEVQLRSLKVLKPGGILASSAGLEVADAADAKQIRTANVNAGMAIADLKQFTTLLENEIVRPVITEVLPLAEARTAHEHIQTGHTRGKIILDVE